jgi:hypothetical protein
MITITATFEIDESKHYFEGKRPKDWFAEKIVSGELAASIHLTEVHNVKIISSKNYNGVPIPIQKNIAQYNILANTIQLKVQ